MISTYVIPGLQFEMPQPFNEVKEMKKLVCSIYNVDPAILFTKTRKREVVMARQAYAAALYEIEHWGPSRIALTFEEGKNHSTIIHCVKTVNNQVDTDKGFRIKFAQLVNEYKRAKDKQRSDTIIVAKMMGLIKDEPQISPSEPRSCPKEGEDTSESARVKHTLTLVA